MRGQKEEANNEGQRTKDRRQKTKNMEQEI